MRKLRLAGAAALALAFVAACAEVPAGSREVAVRAGTGMLAIGAGEARAVMLEKPPGGDWTVAVVEE